MQWLATKLKSARQSFSSDSLFRNAVYLMASTAIMSVLGFGFWIFVAHLYSPGQIGLASALISITLLLSNLSFLGLNAGLLRFLPGSKSASRDINAALITVGVITMAAAAVYLMLGIGGNLPFFTAHPANRILFVVLMAVVSLNTLTDSVFIANRRAELHTIVYAVFGIVKLVLPIVLVALGSLGIFTAYIGAAAASLVLSLILMWRECGYRLWSKPNWSFISGSRKYTTNNYLGVVIAGLPSQIMPSFIVNRLGEAHAGYFSMAWTMANLLYVVPSAITNSLLAESSHNPEAQVKNIRHASRLLAIILVPAVAFAIIIAPYLLKLFGGQYSSGGTAIFRLLAVGAFFIAANSVGNTILNIEHRTSGIVVVQGVIALVTLILAVLLIHLGLVGVGLAILGGNAAGTLVQLFIINRNHKSVTPIAVSASSQLIASFLNEYGLNGAEVGPDIGGGDRSATVVVTQGDVKRVLKISTATKRSRQKINTELEYTDYLRANGIPIPEHIPTPRGSSISEQTGKRHRMVRRIIAISRRPPSARLSQRPDQ